MTFQPGQSGNPTGREKGVITNRIRKLTKREMAKIGEMIVLGRLSDLKAMAADPEASALEVWICSIVMNGINTGDMHRLDQLLTRLIGKPREDVHFTGQINSARVVINIPSNGRENPDLLPALIDESSSPSA